MEMELEENVSKARCDIVNGVTSYIFTKIMHCESSKEMWEKLKTIYEGDAKVKEAKLQVLIEKFEQLKMNEDENIATYYLHIDEIVNDIKISGDEIKEPFVVKNTLRSLPMGFYPNIFSLEERVDLDTITMDELCWLLSLIELYF
jgi:hypothetical protein